jgi:serine/threonine protein kinase
MNTVFDYKRATAFTYAGPAQKPPYNFVVYERLVDGNYNPDIYLIHEAELMETMFDTVGRMRETHALFINGQRLKWTVLLLRLYHIHKITKSKIEVVPLTIMNDMCNAHIIVDRLHEDHPVNDVRYIKDLLTKLSRYAQFAFRRFEDNNIVMEVQVGNRLRDLFMIDLRPYSSGKTGLVQYMINTHLPTGDIIDVAPFAGLEMDRYRFTTQQLWSVITHSPARDQLIKYWIVSTMTYLQQINDSGFIHCNLCMNNVVIMYDGNIKIIGYGECVRKGGAARLGRGHYEYSAPETMLKPGDNIYDRVIYKENIDCFSVGVVAWELATGTHAFPNVEEDSSLANADMGVLYYKRKMSMLSGLWVDSAESHDLHNISKIMGKQLERSPNSKYSLTFFLAQLLAKGDNRLIAKDFANGLDKTADYNLWQAAWIEILTANGPTSLLE